MIFAYHINKRQEWVVTIKYGWYFTIIIYGIKRLKTL